jgi:hypothetical protein
MTSSEQSACPLCGNTDITPYHRDDTRNYLQCGACKLVFVPPGQHLSAADEKACYDRHDNRPDDPGYRHFLERLFAPLSQRLAAHARGLDFGCGPGPTLSVMFEEAGHPMALYDPFYAPDRAVLSGPYDFITLSEVAEHLAAPSKELDNLWAALAPGGWLGIMTKRVRDPAAFKSWHYINDPTHVCFFSEATFQWLADRWSASLDVVGDDVVLMGKAL